MASNNKNDPYIDMLNAGLYSNSGTTTPEVKDTTVMEDLVDMSRGAANQWGLMPVAQGVMHTVFDPLTTLLGGKRTADKNVDLSDKNVLERAIERFKYGYNTTKADEEESMARNPLKYNLANIGVGLLTPAGAVGNAVTKPLGLAAGKLTTKAPTISKVGNALTKEGAVKNITNNAIEGAIDSAMFSEEGEEGKGALLGASIGSAIPTLGAVARKLTPWGAGALGGNLKDLNLYSKKYPEIAEDLKNATKRVDDLENLVEKETQKLNAKYDSDLHKIGSGMADETKKIVQEEDNLVRGVRNQLIDSYNNVEDQIMSHSYQARGNLRKDAFIDVLGIQKEIDDMLENSKINGKSYSASNETSMKSLEQIRDDLVEIAKDGKISEKDLWQYMHDVLSPLSKFTSKELKGYTPPSVAVARILRHKVDDLLKTANPKYQKAMKPTAEMTAFINNDFPKMIDLDNLSSLEVIRKLGANPDGMKAIKKLTQYAGTGAKVDKDLNRVAKIEENLPSSFVGKDNLYMTGVLNKQGGEGLSVEQIQKTLDNYDAINGTDFSSQWNKARKEGKRDTLEAYQELKNSEALTKEDRKGKSFIRRSFDYLDPEKVDGKQTLVDKVIKGNESNPLNEKLLKDQKGLKTIDLISKITGEDAKELERFGRNLSLDKALDRSATNGSRNAKLGATIGASSLAGVQMLYNLLSNNNEDSSVLDRLNKVPFLGGSAGAAIGAILGGARDYGLANRLGKLAIAGTYTPKDFGKLDYLLKNSPKAGLNRLNGMLERGDNIQESQDNDIAKYKDYLLREEMGRRIVPTEALKRTEYINEKVFGRSN